MDAFQFERHSMKCV